jgi:RNA polymerase sigma-70 factor (ECF subfamily)
MLDPRPVAPGTLATKPDDDLLHKHVAGDREAFGVLYERHRSRLRAVASRIAGQQDADDAVQNGMLRAYRTAHRFRGESAVATWLHRIVVNAAIDITRRRPHVAEGQEPWYSDAHIGQADTRMEVRKHWLRLSADHKAALLLVDVMGYPIAEAAKLVGVCEGTMKSRAHRARARLANRLSHLVVPLS